MPSCPARLHNDTLAILPDMITQPGQNLPAEKLHRLGEVGTDQRRAAVDEYVATSGDLALPNQFSGDFIRRAAHELVIGEPGRPCALDMRVIKVVRGTKGCLGEPAGLVAVLVNDNQP